MEMFNKKVAKERIGHLKKSKALDPLRDVERYFLKAIKKYNGAEHSYDVMAQEIPYFKTIGYTEYATCFIMYPLNLDLRVVQMQEAFNSKEDNLLDYVFYFKNNIEKKLANKYQDRKTDLAKYGTVDNLVVLPGSNKLKDRTCLNKLTRIKHIHDDNVYFKPHPITTHAVIGEIKDMFGEDRILPRDSDMYHFLLNSDKIYTTHISESAMYASALGKEIEPIDVHNNVEQGSFYHINKFLFENRDNPGPWINKTLSSYKSGFICPSLDSNWKEKVDNYLDYIFTKRETYKGWYIESKPKKNK